MTDDPRPAMVEALTFDDVLLEPGYSDVLPAQVDVRTRLTREIEFGIPLISAAMDTVTEAPMAIAMAQHGGLGILHKNLGVEEQASQVCRSRSSRRGWSSTRSPFAPDTPFGQALELMQRHSISGLPVVDGPGGRLVGILTNRDVRFVQSSERPVRELMTAERLITVREGVSRAEAMELLHEHRIEKLLVVDDAYRLVGLITVKDIEKAQRFPNACKDEQGRLRVGAATGTGAAGLERAEALIAAGADVIVVDTAHGHSQGRARRRGAVRRLSNATQIIAGNVATGAAAAALIEAGADAIKVGIGPGSICTTRIVAGVGVPQLTAILDVAASCRAKGVPVIADGGIRSSGDLAKAIAAGADCVMLGSMFAGSEESAGRGVPLPGPLLQVLPRHGLAGRDGARLGRPLFPAGGARLAEAGAGRDRGPGALSRAGRQHHPPAGRRPARRHGLHRQRAICAPCRRAAGSCGCRRRAGAKATFTTWRSPARRPTTARTARRGPCRVRPVAQQCLDIGAGRRLESHIVGAGGMDRGRHHPIEPVQGRAQHQPRAAARELQLQPALALPSRPEPAQAQPSSSRQARRRSRGRPPRRRTAPAARARCWRRQVCTRKTRKHGRQRVKPSMTGHAGSHRHQRHGGKARPAPAAQVVGHQRCGAVAQLDFNHCRIPMRFVRSWRRIDHVGIYAEPSMPATCFLGRARVESGAAMQPRRIANLERHERMRPGDEEHRCRSATSEPDARPVAAAGPAGTHGLERDPRLYRAAADRGRRALSAESAGPPAPDCGGGGCAGGCAAADRTEYLPCRERQFRRQCAGRRRSLAGRVLKSGEVEPTFVSPRHAIHGHADAARFEAAGSDWCAG